MTMMVLLGLKMTVFLGSVLALPDLPDNTELMVTVLADQHWVRGQDMDMDSVQEALEQSILNTRGPHVGMQFSFNTLPAGGLNETGLDLGEFIISVNIWNLSC